MKVKIFIQFIIFIFLISCKNETRTLNNPPEKIIGKFIPLKLKTIDETEPDVFIHITKNKIILTKDWKFQKFNEENIINKVEIINNDAFRIYCRKNDMLNTELNIIKKGEDFLISEFIKSGLKDEGGEYGKTEKFGYYKKME